MMIMMMMDDTKGMKTPIRFFIRISTGDTVVCHFYLFEEEHDGR